MRREPDSRGVRESLPLLSQGLHATAYSRGDIHVGIFGHEIFLGDHVAQLLIHPACL